MEVQESYYLQNSQTSQETALLSTLDNIIDLGTTNIWHSPLRDRSKTIAVRIDCEF